MHIKFNCSNPDCQQHLAIDESFAGQSLRCPACGASVQVPKPAEKLLSTAGSNEEILRLQQPQPPVLRIRTRHYFFPMERLLLGWGTGVVLFGILLAGLYIRSRAALPRHFDTMLNEVCSVGNIRGAPVASPDGTELLYARETSKGLGIFLEDLQTLQRKQIGLVNKTVWTATDYFTLIGWSPDNQYLAFRIETSHGESLVICNGNDGSLVQTFVLDDVRHGFWLTNDSLVLMDTLHQLLLIDLKQPSRIHAIAGYTTFGIDDHYTSYALAKMSDHSFAYAERGNVWTLDLNTGEANQLTHFTDNRIEWLDYNPTNDEFLFCLTDLANNDPESIPYLYRLSPKSGTNNLTRLTSAGTFKGQWIYGDSGLAYVGTKGNENYLAVETQNISLCTNLFLGGNIMSYSVSPQRDKMYAVASLGHEPLGIWEYDIARKHLRNVLSGEEHSFTVSHFIAPVQMYVTNNGENIPYFMLPPAKLDPRKRYPVLIDQPVNDRCEPGPQFLANAGVFYVSVNRHGLASSDNLTTAFDDVLAVYHDLLKNPNIDSHRIYLAGACASTTIVSELVDYNPAMWRGIIAFGPASFPDIPVKVATFPSVFVSAGEDDSPSFLTHSEIFAQKASSQLIPMRIIYHKNAGHIFNSTTQAKERYGAAAKFILTDY
jgi:dipeptidyl aminopeptidase/acylaminoacyl peptidase